LHVDEQFGTAVEVPGIRGFTTSVIGKVSVFTELLFNVIIGLTFEFVVLINDVPKGGLLIDQLYDRPKGVFPQ
jgi:hypothetical protein